MLIFVGFNVNAVRIGQTSCGCFGAVTVSPWNALLLDVGLLVVLGVWAVVDRNVRNIRQMASESAAFAVGYGGSAALWLIAVSLTFGSTATARAALRGDCVFLDPGVLDFGPVPGGETAEQTITVRNTGPDSVRLIGGTSNCSCTLIPDLPATIPPGEACRLRVFMRFPVNPGAFEVTGVLWTDSSTNETLPVRLRGRSVGP